MTLGLDNAYLAQCYAAINPIKDDLSLFEHIRLLIGSGYKQSITITPDPGYVLFVKSIEVDNYTNSKYTFIVGNMTFLDNSEFDRGSTLHFSKPMAVGEGDSIYIEISNGDIGSIKYSIVVEGWARKVELEGAKT